MESEGLNSEVLAGGKRFHIQTNYLEPVEKIVSNIFDNGKVIFKKEVHVKNGSYGDKIKGLVDIVHKDMIGEIETLFYISDKVRSIKHAASNNKLGLIFYSRKLYDEAIAEFKTAIDIDPNFSEAHKNLSLTYLKNNHYNEALELITSGIKINPNYPDFHLVRGSIFLEQKKYKEAIEEFSSALKINPDYAEVNFKLGTLYLRTIKENYVDELMPDIQRRKEIAIDHLQKAENFIKSDLLIEAYEYFDEDDIEKTLDVLCRMEDENDESIAADFEYDFYLKFMFGGKGKDDDFINKHVINLKDAIKKYPNYADLRNSLGVAYLIQCRNLFLNALDEFRQALKINPNFAKAAKNLKLAENDGKGFLILLRAILK